MMGPFDYDSWLATPPEEVEWPEVDEDTPYDAWVDRNLGD